MTRVKICGITTPEAMDAAADADWVGFVFFSKSPRDIAPAVAAELAARHRLPAKVALFVDPTDADIVSVLAHFTPDVLQLHTSARRAAAIRARFGIPVWRAVGIATAEDLPTSAEGADALLLDAKPPADATRPGGNATAFDWSLLAGFRPDYPWMLAGGLTPDNVADAIRATGAPAVDVSSGVEQRKGLKDPALVTAFIRNARAALP